MEIEAPCSKLREASIGRIWSRLCGVRINQDFVRSAQLSRRYVRYLECASNSRQRDPAQAVFKFRIMSRSPASQEFLFRFVTAFGTIPGPPTTPYSTIQATGVVRTQGVLAA